MKLLFISIRILIYQFPSGICWLEAAPYACRAERQVLAAAEYIYTYMALPHSDSTFLFSFSGFLLSFFRSRSVVPRVLQADKRLAVMVCSEHELLRGQYLVADLPN